MDTDNRGLARRITAVFNQGKLDLSRRAGAPTPGWAGMPECVAVESLRAREWADPAVRLFLTLVAALDRARDADRLWRAAATMAAEHPWIVDPAEVGRRGTEVGPHLARFGVSQRHGPDTFAWRRIAESLARADSAPAVHTAIYQGRGDTRVLLRELERTSGTGPLFPYLKGPKIRTMWVRLLAVPGSAHIDALDILPVAVDVQVRRVTEYLGVTSTRGRPLEDVRSVIQAAWYRDVTAHGAEGPGQLASTCAALDPALWFHAKWGCTFCEQAGRKLPISEVCRECRFGQVPV